MAAHPRQRFTTDSATVGGAAPTRPRGKSRPRRAARDTADFPHEHVLLRKPPPAPPVGMVTVTMETAFVGLVVGVAGRLDGETLPAVSDGWAEALKEEAVPVEPGQSGTETPGAPDGAVKVAKALQPNSPTATAPASPQQERAHGDPQGRGCGNSASGGCAWRPGKAPFGKGCFLESSPCWPTAVPGGRAAWTGPRGR